MRVGGGIPVLLRRECSGTSDASTELDTGGDLHLFSANTRAGGGKERKGIRGASRGCRTGAWFRVCMRIDGAPVTLATRRRQRTFEFWYFVMFESPHRLQRRPISPWLPTTRRPTALTSREYWISGFRYLIF
eukprot:1249730-Amorphochlora_amoeboformis.AAC.1